ncbi:MAG: T9SS type A sorting domain-containing protein, partial [Saprospiraceae bacterium]
IVEGIENNQYALGYDEGWYEGVSQKINNGPNPVSISPNPATSYMQLLSPNDQQYNLQVYDLMGKVLYKDSFTIRYELNVDNWQRGLYLFVIYDEKGERVQTSKISIQ